MDQPVENNTHKKSDDKKPPDAGKAGLKTPHISALWDEIIKDRSFPALFIREKYRGFIEIGKV